MNGSSSHYWNCYARKQGIAVSAEEISVYLADMQRFMDQDRQRREARRRELREQLQANAAGGEAREILVGELAVLDSLAEMESHESADDTPEGRAFAEQVARAFILRHKVNRALYLQYGGRVIYQQAGPEPLDAYRIYLQEQAAQKNFRILDPALEPEVKLSLLPSTIEFEDF